MIDKNLLYLCAGILPGKLGDACRAAVQVEVETETERLKNESRKIAWGDAWEEIVMISDRLGCSIADAENIYLTGWL